jgi:hypothetical protein
MARALGLEEGSTDLDARIKAELFGQATKRSNIEAGIELVNLSSLMQSNKAHCSNESFIEKAQNLIFSGAYDGKIKSIIITQATLCAAELAEQFQRGLGSLSKSTREHYGLFVKNEKGRSNLDLADEIAEVRRIIESSKGAEDDQSEIRRGYLDACETTNRYGYLMRILKIYKRYAFGMKAYMPLFRYSNFCQTLIKVDPSKELDQAFSGLVEDFATNFGCMSTERTPEESDAQQERFAAKAALETAKKSQ